jgi:8-oxo-dGTP pyrophosphatase MutT (NUDIX family)
MEEPNVPKKDTFAKDLLLADHKYIGELLLKNEQGGETRVHIFITLIAAGIGGFFALIANGKMNYEAIRWLIIAGLIFLLVIGWVTWLRMIKRDTSTDRFGRQIDIIRQTFKQQCDSAGALAYYDLFPKMNLGRSDGIRRFGGLGDTVAVLNGFLAAGLMAAFVLSEESRLSDNTMLGAAAIMAVIAGLAIAAFQVSYADSAESTARGKLAAVLGVSSHAGGVVYEMKGNKAHYLLVRPSNDAEEWVLPKGHIEPGEDHADAALREVREEAGVVAAVLGSADRIQFEKQGKIQDVKFYLMRKVGDVDPSRRKEQRKTLWLPLDEALSQLKFKESKRAIRNADQVRERLDTLQLPLPPT